MVVENIIGKNWKLYTIVTIRTTVVTGGDTYHYEASICITIFNLVQYHVNIIEGCEINDPTK